MTLKKSGFLAVLFLILAGVASAEPKVTEKTLSVRTFTFKYKQAERAAAVIKPLVSEEGSMSIQPSTNALQVTDRAENLKQIAKAISDFDSPAREFHLYVRLVSASRVAEPQKVADDLRDVAQKLSMLKYNAFENVGEAHVEAKEGDPGVIDMTTGYRADFRLGEYDPATDSIKLNDFHLSKLQGAQKDQLTSLLKTTLNLGIGQTYIVGASKTPESQKALMIVLIARR
jgi:hypothetical protein